jgi:hypothetical protein
LALAPYIYVSLKGGYMSLQSKYKKFTETIALSTKSTEYKDAREKDDAIYEKIKIAFVDEGYEIVGTRVLGSMGVHTGIQPLDGDHDIDRGVIISQESSPCNPIDVKKVVKNVLFNHGFSEPSIKKPCVTADYKTKPIHIDYVIFRKDDLDNYELAVGKETSDENNRKWDPSDPIGLKDWLTWKDEDKTSEERNQYYRIVRTLKRWRDHRYSNSSDRKKVYSIGLAVMLREKMCFSIDESGKANDHQALIDTLDSIMSGSYFDLDVLSIFTDETKYDLSVNLPTQPYRDIFTNHGVSVGTKLRKRLKSLLDTLNEVSVEPELAKQCDVLRDVFGDDFPTHDETEARTKAKSAGVMSVSSGA